MNLKFTIDQTVAIVCSGQPGTVIARAEYKTAEPSYLLRYVDGNGNATEAWWQESALNSLEVTASA